MQASTCIPLFLLSLAACAQADPGSRGTAQVACGTVDSANAETPQFRVELDSAAAATLRRIDLEIFPPSQSPFLRLDSVDVRCTSPTHELRLSVRGAWRQQQRVQLGTGTHLARIRVEGTGAVLLDTVLDMSGSAYQSVRWDASR